MKLLYCLVALLACAALFSVEAFETQTVSIYHVNPANYSGITNMDTADAAGDAFFDLRSVMIPMSCRNKSAHHWGNECDNPEQVAPDLVVTKVTVSIKQDFNDTGYARCNVCINGTVPMTWPPQKCKSGDYVCVCGGFGWTDPPTPCDKPVGREYVANLFGSFTPKPTDPAPDFWTHNLVLRTGGTWYSTLDMGENKTWELVETIKTVSHKCQYQYIHEQIKSLDKTKCFDACPPNDVTTDCYVTCFFDTMLGPDAGKVVDSKKGGLTGAQITSIWEKGFEQCPEYKV